MDWTHKKTWLHDSNPSFKLAVMIVLFFFILFIHNPNVQLNILFFLLGTLIFLSGQRLWMIGLFLLPFLFVFFTSSISMIMFGKGETIWFEWGLISISAESFYRGIHIGLRAINFGLLGLIFVFTTRPVLLFYSMMQQWKLKPTFAYSFMAGIRLLPTFVEEFNTLRNAMYVRGANVKKGIFFTMKTYSIPLLSQSIRKAHRIAAAMEAKGFTNEKRTYYYQQSYSRYDAFLFIYIVVMMVAIYLLTQNVAYFPVDNVKS
ncbi:energy-coupling factor transporter transmembrane component T [Bacillus spongiae]|uniref:Energy-coupling factor transporter transmembrane component T n=1 Tax=Bacillus spongiae TaxID=2683610 RepID=A0ABU8HC41_9BACI